MTETHRSKIALLAIRRIFKWNSPAQEAELDQYLAKHPNEEEMLREYPDKDALIRDAIDYERVDIKAAWERFKQRDPVLQEMPKIKPFPQRTSLMQTVWSARHRRWQIA